MRLRRGALCLDPAVVLCLLLAGLEATVAELGGGVDELHLDLLECATAGLGQQGAAKGDGPLLGAGHGALGGREEEVHHRSVCSTVWSTLQTDIEHCSKTMLAHFRHCATHAQQVSLHSQWFVDLLVITVSDFYEGLKCPDHLAPAVPQERRGQLPKGCSVGLFSAFLLDSQDQCKSEDELSRPWQ